MDISINPKLLYLIIFIPFFLISLGIHEFAHAFAANKLGDDTAKKLGRMTLNPLKHLDLFGSIVIPLMSMLSGFAIIGWAKPVPVNPRNFRNPRRDDLIVSAMGPLSNLIFALFLGIVMNVLTQANISIANYLYLPLYFNVFLFFFNLIPIPPLDGSHVMNSLFAGSAYSRYFDQIAKWSLLILMLFIYSPAWKYFIYIVDVTVQFIIG